MNSQPTLAASAPTAGAGFEPRALDPTPAFWFAMFAASAVGTVLGDFWAEWMNLGLLLSFATLVVLTALLVAGDRWKGRETEIFYWLAIVLLRAGATNVGDFLTHPPLKFSYALASLVTAAATLAAGYFTLAPSAKSPSPLIDLRYWAAMLIGGVFGTIAGDLASHSFGMFPALIVLGVALIGVIVARGFLAPASMLGYWCIVLAERAAGTPAGDWFASRRGLGLGQPLALLCTTAALAAALWLYSRTRRAR